MCSRHQGNKQAYRIKTVTLWKLKTEWWGITSKVLENLSMCTKTHFMRWWRYTRETKTPKEVSEDPTTFKARWTGVGRDGSKRGRIFQQKEFWSPHPHQRTCTRLEEGILSLSLSLSPLTHMHPPNLVYLTARRRFSCLRPEKKHTERCKLLPSSRMHMGKHNLHETVPQDRKTA